ncbi:hypothetical protein CJF12_10570 [Chryseobacterium piperi]|uniref:hypothetical protein n=1 Tax=Chryseobacterium piperi TaxID=558152 RepID=UPI0006910772|nr:hypothetical protein [Chryseobacterium piperi]ASW74683.1 hypothetical protein CJF12_10570 [Chryseobacterium piperi]
MKQTIKTTNDRSFMEIVNRLSWTSIFAGVIIAVAVQLLLNLLGLAIGLGSINPLEEAKPFSGLGTGALIWWIVTMLISLFCGGWVAGWFSNQVNKTDLALHGLITWCLLTILNIYIITASVGKIVGGVGSVINKGFDIAGEGVKAVAPQAGDMINDQLNINETSIGKLKTEAETLLKQTDKKQLRPENLESKSKDASEKVKGTANSIMENPQESQAKLDSLFSKLFKSGDATFEAVDRDALANIVMHRTGKSKAESEQIVDNWVKVTNEAKAKIKEVKEEAGQKAKEVGEDVASGLSKFALFSFFGLLLGAVSAAIGAGIAGNKQRATVVVVEDTEA